jgi:hypothetical protein
MSLDSGELTQRRRKEFLKRDRDEDSFPETLRSSSNYKTKEKELNGIFC